MPSPYHTPYAEGSAHQTKPGPTLRTPKPSLGTKEPWKPPSAPGKGRKVHKSHGKRVKTHLWEEF